MARNTSETLRMPCPCCHKDLVVNTRARTIRAANPKDADGGRSLDDLVEEHKKQADTLGDLFEDAKGGVAQRGEELNALFDDAIKKVRGDTAKPRNPFDLD